MNASSISSTDFNQSDASDSDADASRDEVPEYYQPISNVGEDEGRGGSDVNSDEEHSYHFHQLPNGYCSYGTENGMSSLVLNDDVGVEQMNGEDEEEERMREASERAIRMAFREDENRRNAPLSVENATRVREAMRGVSFGGIVPDWAAHVPEDRWIDQLRRLREIYEKSR
ncbi:uncharacterized protein LOC114747717 isoform X2 [Neltuma alba]|uniref:uncharacterized protein LOC114726479 isoform X2 n=1 Tax=Neltuma alba TaxID=207710 RepID=UPI0010A3231D|nr:uncharacterized protein LOC114726479 isoform X2 [Prosopis alba]XP_028791898.1 uncharacterized protein LOC114747717 isoform X2 [Prosopis alba]